MKPRDFKPEIQHAVAHFWTSRTGAGERQLTSDDGDRGERANVTSGKHLDGFADFFTKLAREIALPLPMVEKQAQLKHPARLFPPDEKVGSDHPHRLATHRNY